MLLCSKIFSITLITGYRFMSKKALHPIEGGGGGSTYAISPGREKRRKFEIKVKMGRTNC